MLGCDVILYAVRIGYDIGEREGATLVKRKLLCVNIVKMEETSYNNYLKCIC